MSRLRYLVDTSVLARLSKPTVRGSFTPLVSAVAICAPVAFELGYAARSADDYRQLADRLLAFPQMPTTEADHRRALEIQAVLADRNDHRSLPLVDALVAAIAEARNLTVLHYDADFVTIAEITGQPHRWIVDRGTAD